MAKKYHLKEIIGRELGNSYPFGIYRTNKAKNVNSRLSSGYRAQLLNETAIWKAALQLETSGMELFD
jgi:hypothetical protein